jgi:ribonuclease BN (tRNA processing enzyme)
MKKYFALTALLLLLVLSTITALEPGVATKDFKDDAIHLTIIYDNYQADLYKKNVNLLDIHPEEIPTLFISHEHGDHTAGIPWIIEVNPYVNCYLPASYAEQLKASGTLPPNSKAIKKPGHLYGPFYSTGDNSIASLKASYGENYISGGPGKEIIIQ